MDVFIMQEYADESDYDHAGFEVWAESYLLFCFSKSNKSDSIHLLPGSVNCVCWIW